MFCYDVQSSKPSNSLYIWDGWAIVSLSRRDVLCWGSYACRLDSYGSRLRLSMFCFDVHSSKRSNSLCIWNGWATVSLSRMDVLCGRSYACGLDSYGPWLRLVMFCYDVQSSKRSNPLYMKWLSDCKLITKGYAQWSHLTAGISCRLVQRTSTKHRWSFGANRWAIWNGRAPVHNSVHRRRIHELRIVSDVNLAVQCSP
jgi:hypothetical protein